MTGVSDELINTLLVTHFIKQVNSKTTNSIISDNYDTITETIARMIKSPAHNITTTYETKDDVIYINIDKDTGDLNITTTEICHVSAFEHGKELSVPYDTINGLKNTFDMIYNLFDCNIINPETVFHVIYKNRDYKVTWCYDDIITEMTIK